MARSWRRANLAEVDRTHLVGSQMPIPVHLQLERDQEQPSRDRRHSGISWLQKIGQWSVRFKVTDFHPTLPETKWDALFRIFSGSSSNREPFTEKITSPSEKVISSEPIAGSSSNARRIPENRNGSRSCCRSREFRRASHSNTRTRNTAAGAPCVERIFRTSPLVATAPPVRNSKRAP